MGWFTRPGKPPKTPDRADVTRQQPDQDDPRQAAIRAYRDPMHPERPVHPKKVARTLYASIGSLPSPEIVAREAAIAGVDAQAVHSELESLHKRDLEQRDAPDLDHPKAEHLDVATLTKVDLTTLDAMGARIVGQSHWLDHGDRSQFHGATYLLVREPHNPHDENAIAVYGRDRKVGYVSAGRAKQLAPLLDRIGVEAFVVLSGKSEGSKHEVMLPRVPSLREFAAG